MIYALVILYLLGAVLGASSSMAVGHKLSQVIFCAVAWPVVAIVSAAGMIVGYLEAKKGLV